MLAVELRDAPYVNCAWLGGCWKVRRLTTGDALGGAEGGEDGIGETSSQQSQTGGLVLAPGLLLGQIGMAGADAPRAWVTAIMWRAQLVARLPPRLRRTLPALAPDHTGIGAVPVNRA